MEWDEEASAAVARVPFFVRKKVRARVEEEARRSGAARVDREHVQRARQRYLERMEDEVTGYQVEGCFGAGGCPNRIGDDETLVGRIEEWLAGADLKAFLRERVNGPLKMHHEFRVSVSGCPNGCSRPQIVDIGLLGACRPGLADEPCSRCGECVAVCEENAIALGDDGPVIDFDRCLACGHCLRACPTGTLTAAATGYRILVGGRLGRHPRLGRELAGIFSPAEALAMVRRCLELYKIHNRGGERFGAILDRLGPAALESAEPG